MLPALQRSQIHAVWLANNHILDYRQPIAHTRSLLAKAGIQSFGAGATVDEASKPLLLNLTNGPVKVFAFGSPLIGCRLASHRSEGVNPLTPDHLLNTIRQVRARDSDSCVIYVMHWNYELEQYPQPAERQLARDLIREGVDAIVGCHAHIVQGAELFEGKPVVYGLGNWFFPPHQVGHMRLQFPPIAHRELALELDISGRQIQSVQFHWHQFDPEDQSITHECTEGWDGEILRELTPFAGMEHAEYVQWFRENRRKRKGLPVFVDYRQRYRNHLKDATVMLRQTMIEALLRLHLKGGPRE